ncbi:MAG TPA: GFA family protein [Caulobacteraceae bacterium]|jgi:hypothetical protein|nr:GFA family protein [Caulobacteraceae bacterium]
MIEATCHCEAVKFEVAHAPEWVNSCNCSICRRLGTLCAYYALGEVRLVSPDPPLGDYVWGDRMITFHHCQVCGCPTHWTPNGEEHPDRMGFNARLFDPEVMAGVRIRRFDGAKTWKFLDEG